MAIRHTFSSPKADSADATLVRPSDWNATHDDGGLATAVDVVSNAASNALSVGNAASNAASIVSQALSVETVNRVSADDALSNAISVVSALVAAGTDALADADATSQPWETIIAGSNVTITELADGHAIQIDIPAIDTVSNAVSILSQATSVADAALSARIDTVSNGVSVVSNAASNAMSVANAASNAASIVSQALSVETINRISADNLLSQSISVLSNAASNALSVGNAASNAASVVSQALSVEIVNRVSADNALSALIDTVSNVASNATSIANAASNAASMVSQAVSVVSAYLEQVAFEDASGTSQPWDMLIAGTNVTFTELADGHALQIDATAGSGSVTSTELSAASAQAASAIAVVSNAVSNLTSIHDVLSNLVSNALSAGDTLSTELSALNATGVDGSQTGQPWDWLLAGTNVTFTEVADGHALVIDAAAGSGSATSTELSAVSAQAASAIDVVSVLVSNLTSLHNGLSNIVSDALSAGAVIHATQVDGSQTGQPWDWLLAGTNVTFTELADGHALQIDATAGAGSATSNEVSIVSAQAASAINVVSNALSVEIIDRVSADNALSLRVDAVSQAASVLSNAASNALSVGNAASNAASIVSQALSVEIINRVSADNALSALIDTVSNVASNATSIANAASNAASIVSQAVSVVSAYLEQVALEDASGTSQPWDLLIAGTNITFTELADGHALQIDATAGAGSVTSAELQVVSAQAASIANVVSNTLSIEIIDRISADNALSARIDTVSQGVSVVSNAASNAMSVANAASNAASVVSQALSVEIVNRVSADNALSALIDTVSNVASNATSIANAASNAASIVSQAVSVVSAYLDQAALEDASMAAQPWDMLIAGTNVTFTELADGHAILIDATAGAGSVTSNELSIVSAQAASAINVASNATSVVSAALGLETIARVADDASLSARIDTVSQGLSVLSNAASNALSVANAASNAASIVSQAVSVETVARVLAVDTVSNAVSALEVRVSALSAAPGGGSVTSAELEKATLVDGDATQQVWETVIAGDNVTLTELGDGGGHAIKLDVTGPTTRVVGDDQGISATSQTNISGMSVSVVAGGIYRLDAMVLVNRGAGAAVAKMGLTFPAMKTARGYIKYTLSSPNGLPGTTTEVVSSQGFFALIEGDSASGSIIVSALNTVGAVVSNLAVYQGLFVVSTSGVIQLQAGASTSAGTGLTILAGSYMQVFRIA